MPPPPSVGTKTGTGDMPRDDRPQPTSRKFLVALVLILIIGALWIIRPLLAPVVLGLLGGFLLNPVHHRLVRHVRWPSLSATLLLLAVILALVAPFVILVWRLFDDASDLVVRLQDPEQLQALAEDIAHILGVDTATVVGWANDLAGRAATLLAGMIVPALRFIIDFTIALVVFLFVLFFAIRDGHHWIALLKSYLPLDPEETLGLLEGARTSLRAFVLGTVAVAGIQGLVAGIIWWILGFPNPVLWGFVLVFLGILPFGGPFMITIPASIIAILQGDIFAGIALFVLTITVVGFTDDLLRPILVGRAASIHPALVLIGMIGGVLVMGAAGLLLGPLVFALLGPVLDVWSRRRKERAENAATVAA